MLSFAALTAIRSERIAGAGRTAPSADPARAQVVRRSEPSARRAAPGAAGRRHVSFEFAYLDPGSGSMIIQAVIAAAVSLPILFRDRVGRVVRRVFRR